MVLDTRPVEKFVKTHYKAILLLVLIVVVVVVWAHHKKTTPVQTSKNSQPKIISWSDSDKTQFDKSDALNQEAGQLVDQGNYAEAIPKFKAALDALPYALSYTDFNDFTARNPNQSLDEKKNTLGEIQGINNTMARINYSLSFAYRDGKDIQNNYQNAISTMKDAIDEFNEATKAQNIEKQVDQNNKFIDIFATDRNKTLASYDTQLGDLYRLYGAYDLSIQTHQKAIELDPTSTDAYTWYGMAYIANSQRSLGCQQLNQALKLDSTNADASKYKNEFCK